jgi:hypothetical protein
LSKLAAISLQKSDSSLDSASVLSRVAMSKHLLTTPLYIEPIILRQMKSVKFIKKM